MSDSDFSQPFDEDSDSDFDIPITKKRKSSNNSQSKNIKIENTPKNISQPKEPSVNTVKAPAKRSKPESSVKSKSTKKVQNVSEKAGMEMIRDYMIAQNRPYSHLNVYENLHKAVKKSQVPLILEKLCDSGSLQRKDFGKVKVYLANQKNMNVLPPEELKQKQEELKSILAKTKEITSENAVLSSEISALNEALSNEDLDSEIRTLTEENVRNQTKVLELQSSGTKVLTEDEMSAKYVYIRKLLSLWKARRRGCMEMIGVYGEGSMKKNSEIFEELGIETDEEVSLSMKEFFTRYK